MSDPSERDMDRPRRPPCEAVAHMSDTPPEGYALPLERRVCPTCRLYFDTGPNEESVFCSLACANRYPEGVM